MANSIIVPCSGNPINSSPLKEDYLIKGNFLGEFETKEDKAKARINLEVKSEEETDQKFLELSTSIENLISTVTKHLLDLDDPHKTLNKIEKRLEEYAKLDGSTPFTHPQKGVTPATESDLTTKKYVDESIINYFKENNIEADEKLFEKVKLYLTNFAKKDDVYRKDQTFSKKEISCAFDKVVLKDGSVPFENPVSGRDPKADSHLTTKRYVDKALANHLLAEDPHGIKLWILDVLKGYASKADMAKVNEQDVRRYAEIRVRELLSNLEDSSNPLKIADKLEEWGYVKKDGTTPFEAPQEGKDAIKDNDLTTLKQVTELITSVTSKIEEQFKKTDSNTFWYTEGPVEATVGFVENNTTLPEKLSLQQIMDLIFYGKGINIIVPEWAEPGSIVKVCLQVKGSPKRLKKVTVKQQGKVIWTGVGEDFDGGEVCFDSEKLVDDPTNWTVEIEYLKGTATVEAQTKLIGGSFFGLLDIFKHASTLQYEDYVKLAKEDPENFKKIVSGDLSEVTMEFNFESYKQPKQIFCAIPMKSPDLTKLITKAQSFNVNKEGWNIVEAIPLDVNGVTTMYKVFVYKEPIVALNNEEVIFKF